MSEDIRQFVVRYAVDNGLPPSVLERQHAVACRDVLTLVAEAERAIIWPAVLIEDRPMPWGLEVTLRGLATLATPAPRERR